MVVRSADSLVRMRYPSTAEPATPDPPRRRSTHADFRPYLNAPPNALNKRLNLVWNGPVKSGSAELAELLFGAFEREGLGFFQN